MVNLGGLNTNKSIRLARRQCARCDHVFEDNEFKVLTDSNEFVCEGCVDKV